MRPGVRPKKLKMPAKALAQVRAEPVIDRTAVGEVGVHITEGNAIGISGGIAARVESLARQTAFDGLREGHAGPCTGQRHRGSNRRIQSAGPEEVHQSRADPRAQRTRSARSGSAPHGERTGGRLARGQRRVEIGNHQVSANRVRIDRPVEVSSAVVVVGER